ncbi:protein of unknown function [Methylacidimicrobium sp. AP8]|uniref:ATPase, T2SS/T4P/T4SS family n=1 Tax=Methylacidimicrobium sp. AP8 TaxID=2730359 RepID=UPI0018C1B08C|nr:ATPase, T2SS/T4P/T4SS family [Methylacidimicrobium sp. AP8]CAB4244698.1 protein of unknown function [Methylacidimicrobium sp. AP8]
MNDLDEILASALARGATAVHLYEGEAPAVRVQGRLAPLPFPPVCSEQVMRWLQSLAGREGWREAEHAGSGPTILHAGPGGIAFRGRFCAGRPTAGLVLFPLLSPPPFEPRTAPHPLRHLGDFRGLVLLAGGVAGGKTTLLASLIAWLGDTRSWRILALEEEPARFSYPFGRSWINRWQAPRDSSAMAAALGSPLARDADMVAIDSLGGAAAIAAALDLAESGKLVLATYEAEGASAAVASLVHTLQQSQKDRDAERLAATLRLVVSTTLPLRLDGKGFAVLYETLPVHRAVAAAIRDGAIGALEDFVQVGLDGSKHIDDALWELCQSGTIEPEEAFRHAREKERFLERLDADPTIRLMPKE